MTEILIYSHSHLHHLKALADSWGDVFWSPDEVEKSLSFGHNRCQLLMANGLAVGCVFYSIQAFESELLFLFISEDNRHSGFGRILMSAYIDACKEESVDSLFLEVRKSNESALNLYRSMGYESVGERKQYYQDGETAIMLKKELC